MARGRAQEVGAPTEPHVDDAMAVDEQGREKREKLERTFTREMHKRLHFRSAVT